MSDADVRPDLRAPLQRFLLRHPAIAVTVAYLSLTTIGVTFSYAHFNAFGVDVFDFWQPSDLVLAGFREPASFVYAAFALAIGWSSYREQANRRQRLERLVAELEAAPRDGLRGAWARLRLRWAQDEIDYATGRSRPFGSQALGRFGAWTHRNLLAVQVVVAIAVYAMVVLMHVEERRAHTERWFPRARVEVAAATPTVLGDDRRPLDLIGASNGFLFLADDLQSDVTIVPLNSVVRFELGKTHPLQALRRAFSR